MHRLIGAAIVWFAGIHIIYFGMIFNGASRYPRNPVWAWVSGFVAAEIFVLKFAAALCVAIAVVFTATRLFILFFSLRSLAGEDQHDQKAKPAALKIPPVPVQKHPEPLVFQNSEATNGALKSVPKSEYVYVPPSPEEVKKNALKQLLRRGS
jgi:hypothetical protein